MTLAGRWLSRYAGLEGLPDDVSWRLIRLQLSQWIPTMIAIVAITAYCVVCFAASGSPVYIVACVCNLAATSARVALLVAFARQTERRDHAQWSVRIVLSAWLTAAGWGTLAATLPSQSDFGGVAVLLGLHAALLNGGSVNNSPIRLAAFGQVVISSVSLMLACAVSSSPWLQFYACLVAIQLFAGLSISRWVNEQMLRSLNNEKAARELAAELARANEALAHLNDHLQEEAAMDPLTELLNRRAFDFAALREWRVASRDLRPIAVLMMDVDHFKAFNDRYGHQAGDDCLRVIASVLADAVRRPADIVGRYGGEEFIALLPDTTGHDAAAIGATILAALAARVIPHDARLGGRVSMSIGVAATTHARGMSLHALIGAADRGLYAAKNAGRDCLRTVVVDEPVGLVASEAA